MKGASAGDQRMDHDDRQNEQGVEEILEWFFGRDHKAEEGEDAGGGQNDQAMDPEALLQTVEQGVFTGRTARLAATHAAGREALFLEKPEKGHG